MRSEKGWVGLRKGTGVWSQRKNWVGVHVAMSREYAWISSGVRMAQSRDDMAMSRDELAKVAKSRDVVAKSRDVVAKSREMGVAKSMDG